MKKEEKKRKVIKLSEKKKSLTLKNSDLEMLINSDGLGNLRQSKDLPITFSFRLADLLGKLQPTIKAYSEQKQNLIEKYADRDKEDKLVQPSPGQFLFTTKAQWFQKEFTELLKAETTVDCAKLVIEMENVPKGIISANDIISLMSIINFKEK